MYSSTYQTFNRFTVTIHNTCSRLIGWFKLLSITQKCISKVKLRWGQQNKCLLDISFILFCSVILELETIACNSESFTDHWFEFNFNNKTAMPKKGIWTFFSLLFSKFAAHPVNYVYLRIQPLLCTIWYQNGAVVGIEDVLNFSGSCCNICIFVE